MITVNKSIKYLIVVHVLVISISYLGLVFVSTKDVDTIANQVEVNHPYLYFAYGSNMSSKYLINVRGIVPEKKDTGALDNYEFSIGLKGINSLEPGFASITPSQGKKTYGVIYMLTKGDFEKILSSESSRYEMRKVLINTSFGEVLAHTLVLDVADDNEYLPSKRYLDLVLSGAKENNLPSSYISEIESNPTADYFPVASELMGAVIQGWVFINARWL